MSEADVIAALAGFLSADKQTRESASAQLVQVRPRVSPPNL